MWGRLVVLEQAEYFIDARKQGQTEQESKKVELIKKKLNKMIRKKRLVMFLNKGTELAKNPAKKREIIQSTG